MRQKVQEYRFLFFVSMLIGIVCHGFMIFNKFSLNDDNDCLFRLGITFAQGRWALGILDTIAQKLGTYSFSLPVFNGILLVSCISLAACLICEIFEIKDKINRVLIAGIMMVFPEIASTLGFMFQAWTWGLALLLVVFADYLILKTNTWKSIVAGVLICISLGLYQGFLATGICICNLYFCFKKTKNFKEDILALLKTILFFALGVVEYILANSFFLRITDTKMTSYQNMDSWGIVSAKEYLGRIEEAAVVFIKGDIAYTEVGRKFYPACIIVLTFVSIIWFIILFKRLNKKIYLIIWKTLIMLCLPFAFGFHYIIGGATIHPEMVYSSCLILVSILIFAEMIRNFIFNEIKNISVKDKKRTKKCSGWNTISYISKYIAYVVAIVMFVDFFRYDNILYFKASTEHEEDVAFLNRLATRIQSVEGYNDDYPVYFYNIEQVHDNSFFRHPQLAGYDYLPYKNQINNMDIYWYLNNWVGYGPQMAAESETEQIISSKEFAEMSVYPDDGSIRIINNVIVVKCTE